MISWDNVQRVSVTWTINLINLLYFICTFGHSTAFEGRFYKTRWVNWNLHFSCKPKNFLQPTSQSEICSFVRDAIKVRVVAGGHSFNDGTLTDYSLLNFDKFNQVEHFDKTNGVITVQAGLRLRDLIKIIEKDGWDLPVMGTTNVQSIGGLIASDLHATGRESGFLSQQVESLRIINSQGVAEEFTEQSDVFRFALGGVGALGVVVAVRIRLVKKFLVRRVTKYVERKDAEAALDKLLQKHEHVGFFYIGGLRAQKIRLTTYDRAAEYETRSRFYYLKNCCAQLFDLMNGGFYLDFIPYLPALLQSGYFIWNNSFLGEPFIGYAGEAFTSELFFRHDEMEYAMPLGNFKKTIRELTDYLDANNTISLMEVRFTLKNAKTKSHIGPAAGRESCWIEILPTLTHDTRAIFSNTENIFVKNEGRPHLGKFTTFTAHDMRRQFGDDTIDRLGKAMEKQDPDGKFVNAFVHQVFQDNTPSNPHHQRY